MSLGIHCTIFHSIILRQYLVQLIILYIFLLLSAFQHLFRYTLDLSFAQNRWIGYILVTLNILTAFLRKWWFTVTCGWKKYCSNGCWSSLALKRNCGRCDCDRWDNLSCICSNAVHPWQRTRRLGVTDDSRFSVRSQSKRESCIQILLYVANLVIRFVVETANL